MSGFEIVTTSRGVTSILDRATGEIMHNPVGPWAEANALYITQSNLADRLRADGPELIIFDVGLGAAANALAVLHLVRTARPCRAVRLVSFERELRLAEFALDHAAEFAHFNGCEAALRQLITRGSWDEPGFRWELRHGDFNDLIGREPHRAELIFFDPYSPKKNVDMWTTHTFRRLRERTSERALLLTYSRSTPVRVALLRAGFYVGAGYASGLKDETTEAARDPKDLKNALRARWLERWRRSHAPFAPGADRAEQAETAASIESHPQFVPTNPAAVVR